jgi:D-alanine-D-alanine ligase
VKVVVLHNAVDNDACPHESDVSVQRDVVLSALGESGYTASSLECTLDLESLRGRLVAERPDVVFNLVESLGGTDRLMPLAALLLDALQIPYTGASSDAILATSNKLEVKQRLRQANLPTPDWICGNGKQPTADDDGNSTWILKPIWEHASVGMDDDAVVQVADLSDLQRQLSLREARLKRPLFAERFVEGREFNLSLLAGEVLPPAEIDFTRYPPGKPRIVGQQAKWEESSFEHQQTPRRFDFAECDQPLLNQLMQYARACWRLFQLKGFARIDFRVDGQGQAWILEVNVNPCLAPDAGFAAALETAGKTIQQAVACLINEALAVAPDLTPSLASRRLNSDDVGLTMREAVTVSDRETVRQMTQATGFFRPDEVDVAVELVDERLAKGAASNYEFLFTEVAGQVAGYACYGPIACSLGSYDLYWIVVDPAWQGKGIGQRLVQTVEQKVAERGGRQIWIETSGRPQYAPTRSFYRRCGYEVYAELPGFYDMGDDKVIWGKTLTKVSAAET